MKNFMFLVALVFGLLLSSETFAATKAQCDSDRATANTAKSNAETKRTAATDKATAMNASASMANTAYNAWKAAHPGMTDQQCEDWLSDASVYSGLGLADITTSSMKQQSGLNWMSEVTPSSNSYYMMMNWTSSDDFANLASPKFSDAYSC